MTTYVQDTFTEASDTVISSHTPDIDSNGTGWVALDGTPDVIAADDRLRMDAANDSCAIDTGAAGRIVATVTVNPGGADNRWSIHIKHDGNAVATANSYVLNVRTDAGGTNVFLQEWTNGSSTNLDSSAETISNSADEEWELEYNNGTITGRKGGVDIVSATDTTHAANQHVALQHNAFANNSLRFDDLLVTDGAAGGATVGPQAFMHLHHTLRH